MARAPGRLRAVVLCVGIVLALSACRDTTSGGQPVALPVAGRLVLNGVTVVDTADGSLAPGMSILADGGRIVRVAPTGTLAPDASAEAVDATGKFVVPGYLDMHAHPLGEADPTGDLALMLANGVTGFRQMQGSSDLLEQRRDGTLPLTLDAPALLAMPGQILTPLNARNAEAAAATVREQAAEGADFIKVGLARPEAFFAALAEAGRSGIPVAGHVPADVDVVAASADGMRSIEHLGPANGLLVACSSDEAELRKDAPRIPGLLGGLPFRIPFADALVGFLIRDRIINPAAGAGDRELARIRRAVATYSDRKCRQAAASFAANGTWHVPTLIRLRSSQLAFEPELRDDSNLRYVDRSTVERWAEVTRRFEEELSPEDEQTLRDAYALALELVRLMDAQGVKMMAGSDAVGAGWLVPGFSLHREFDELEKAGLSPLRVLQMATRNGAEFLGRTSSMGSVEPGKDADLVLLDANPIESVQNLHRIHAVVRSGFYRDRADLEALKARVESRAAAH
jgi:imidazolonepropionase-like amidohydrolase